MTYKGTLSKALMGAILLVLAGCLGRQTESAIVLTWWVTFAQDSQEYPVFQSLAEAYTAETGQRVKLVSVPWADIVPWGYGDSQLAIAQKSGTGPDLWGPVPHNWTGSFAAQGQALPLEPHQVKIDPYIDAAVWACQFDQKLYALPILIDSLALIYNVDMVPDPPRHFDELLEIARTLTDAEKDQWGLALPLLSQYHTYPFIEGYGGYLFQRTQAECNVDDIGLNNQGAVQGVQFLSDLYLQEKLFPEQLADRAVMHSHALHLFTQGRAAMLIDGSWVMPEIRASGIRYGVSTIPPLPGTTRQPRPLSIVQALYISAGSPHPDQAVAFLAYLSKPEQVTALQAILGKAPVRRDVMRSATFEDHSEVDAWYRQAMASTPLPNTPELDMVWRPWGQALDEAIPGLTPVQEALDRAVQEIKGAIEDAREE
jgi:maltose-binding protein MalE